MGLKNSKVGWFSFIGGVTGYTTGMMMIWWMNAFDYPIVVGGKPMFSPFGAFPPSYELTILFGAFGSLFGMLFLNRLPRLHHPLLKNRPFRSRHARPLFRGDRNALTRNIPKPKPASCWKRPAASTSKWWRNNALLPLPSSSLCVAGRRGHPACAAPISARPPL